MTERVFSPERTAPYLLPLRREEDSLIEQPREAVETDQPLTADTAEKDPL